MEMIPTICSKYFRNHSKFDTNISFDISGWAGRMFGKRWFQICSGSSWGRFQVIIADEKAWITIPFKFIWFCWLFCQHACQFHLDSTWDGIPSWNFFGWAVLINMSKWVAVSRAYTWALCLWFKQLVQVMCIFCGVLLEGTRWFDGSGVQNSLKFNNNISEIGGCPYF